MAPEKTVLLLNSQQERELTLAQKLLGTFCVSSFIVIWLSSLLSPFLLIFSLLHRYYGSAAFIILVTILAYLPWTYGAKIGEFYSRYHPYYYQESLVVFEGKPPSPDDPQTFFAVHPHGAFSLGWAHLFCLPALRHVRFCFSPALFASPFFRLFSRCTGNPGSAGKHAMISYLKAGMNLALPPGGFEEATLTSLKHDRVFIRKRTGFIKLCLMHGVAVRPVYAFGERSTFWNLQGMWGARLALNRLGFPAILIWGHPFFPILPKSNVKLHIVVGNPVILPKIEKPSKEDIRVWHDKYMAALVCLFEEHKVDAYGEEGKGLKLDLW